MATLPRGIQVVRRTNAIYYRVKVARRGFKADKYFKDPEEAKEFLALTKAKRGKELIYSITEEEKKQKVYEKGNYTLGHFIDLFIEDYINSKKIETELQQRNKNNKLSFLNTLKKTSVLNRHMTFEEKDDLGIDTLTDPNTYTLFGGFDVRKIRAIDVNNYIKARLHFVKPISVSRELTYLSNVFKKLQYFDEELADIQNPTRTYDKDLLGSYTVKKREAVISEEDEVKLFATLLQKDNKELFKIAKLSLLTACRRSEIVYLNKEQIKQTFIDLVHTKSGKPRKVFLTKEAKYYIETLEVLPNGRFFKYTIGGFDRVFREVLQKAKLEHIHFHDLRRTNISRLLTRIGNDNTILATEILGLQSVRKFEEVHSYNIPIEPTTQAQAMKSFGHSSAQVTKGYYNIVFKNINLDVKKK